MANILNIAPRTVESRLKIIFKKQMCIPFIN
ncbi:hypothetical protein [Candidatus Arsenophonus nilaparvatae]